MNPNPAKSHRSNGPMLYSADTCYAGIIQFKGDISESILIVDVKFVIFLFVGVTHKSEFKSQ